MNVKREGEKKDRQMKGNKNDSNMWMWQACTRSKSQHGEIKNDSDHFLIRVHHARR